MKNFVSKWAGPALVALASLMWATDGLFRLAALEGVSPTFVVGVEHLVGVLLFAPWIFLKHGEASVRLGWRAWLASFCVGVGGSALATLLFTASFKYVNPSVALLLQKLQPVFVVLLARIFLKEQVKPGFWIWGGLALVAATALSAPELDFKTLLEGGVDLHSRGVLYALAAMALWAGSTVVGKSLLGHVPADVGAFWRYVWGAGFLALIFLSGGDEVPWVALGDARILGALAYLSTFAGILAMAIYYAGLRRTTASVTTFLELLYPLGGVLLNLAVLGIGLTALQWGAGALLLFSVWRVAAR